MATKLDKDLNRETSVKFDDREVIITLTKEQTINFKLKGMKSGHLSISIEDLYRHLKGYGPKDKQQDTGSLVITNEVEQPRHKNGKNMISLHDLRSQNSISTLPYEDKVKFESIIINLMD
mgnify:CR=1 FL=1